MVQLSGHNTSHFLRKFRNPGSENLGGTIGASAFKRPENVVHQDIVYARGNPIQATEATIVGPAGRTPVIGDSSCVVF